MNKITLGLLTLFLPGCAALRTIEPNTLPIEVTHVSHLTQHFGVAPTNYGYNALSLGAKWRLRRFSLEINEGIVLDRAGQWIDLDTGRQQPMHGGLLGPREVFTGRITYEIPLK